MVHLLALAAAVSGPTASALVARNSVEILNHRISGAKRFSISVAFRAGSAFEAEQTHGAFHLLEHILFLGEGDERMGPADWFAERHGSSLSATTYRELMVLQVEGPSDQWRNGVKAIAMLLRKPNSSAESIKREVAVIREEVALQQADRSRMLLDATWSHASANPSFGRSTAGSTARMELMTGELIHSLYDKHFVGSNCVASFAGDADAKDALAAELAFLPKGERSQVPKFDGVKAGRTEVPSVSGVGAGFAAPGVDEKGRFVAWRLISNLLYMMAKSERMEVDISFGPSAGGSVAAITTLDGDEKKLRALLLRISSSSFTAADLDLAKRSAKSRIQADLRNPARVAFLSSTFRLLGSSLPNAEQIDAVTLDALNSAAAELEPSKGAWIQGTKR